MTLKDWFDGYIKDASGSSHVRIYASENPYKIMSHGLPIDDACDIVMYKDLVPSKECIEVTIYFRALVPDLWTGQTTSINVRADVELKKEDFEVFAGLSDSPEQLDAIIYAFFRQEMKNSIKDYVRMNERFGNG